MKVNHVLALVCLGAAVASVYGARRAATGGATVSAEAAAFHGAAELYRTLAMFFGKQALRAEARYWEAIKNG
jgi:hypothetical protein